MADTQHADAWLRTIMRDFVEPQLTTLLPLEYPFLLDFEVAGSDIFVSDGAGGYKIFEPLQLRIPWGARHMARGGNYPDAQPSTGQRAEFQLKLWGHKIYLDESILEQAASKPDFVADYLGTEVKGGMEAGRLDLDRVLHTGAAGYLAKTTSDISGQSCTADNIEILGDMPGRVVDVYAPDSTPDLEADGVVIESVDRAAGTVTFVGTVTDVDSGSWIMEDGAPLITTNTPFGFNDVFATGRIGLVDTDVNVDFGEINRATAANAFWKGEQLSVGAAFSFMALQEGIDAVKSRSGKKLQRLYMNPAMKRKFMTHYVQVFPGQSPSPVKMKPGYTGLGYQAGETGLVVVEDKKIPSGEIWGSYPPSLKVRQVKPIHFRNVGGGRLLYDQDKERTYAYLRHQRQLTCNNPAANIRMYGIT